VERAEFHYPKECPLNRVLSIALIAVVSIVLTGCKSEAESAMSDMVDKQKEIVKVLKGVKDKESAAAAKPKLESLGKEMEKVADRLGKVKDQEEQKKTTEKYKTEFEQVSKDMFAEMMRISQIPGAAEELSAAFMGAPGFGDGMRSKK
jgi:hypothetical protein